MNIIYLLSVLFAIMYSTSCHAQSPLPKGSIIAEYQSKDGAARVVFGINLDTDTYFTIRHRVGGVFDVKLSLKGGRTFEGLAGESFLLPSESPTIRFAEFEQPIPLVTKVLLSRLQPDDYSVSDDANGGKIFSCKLLAGSLWLTIDGMPDNFDIPIELVQYRFSPDGRLDSITNSTTNKTNKIAYSDSTNPQLAVSQTFSDGSWILSDSEISVPSDAESFQENSIVERARQLLISYNQAQEQLRTSPDYQHDMAELADDLSIQKSPLKSSRAALIITGILVIGVGSLAWWRNRS